VSEIGGWFNVLSHQPLRTFGDWQPRSGLTLETDPRTGLGDMEIWVPIAG
jgi:hypothetical protein